MQFVQCPCCVLSYRSVSNLINSFTNSRHNTTVVLVQILRINIGIMFCKQKLMFFERTTSSYCIVSGLARGRGQGGTPPSNPPGATHEIHANPKNFFRGGG